MGSCRFAKNSLLILAFLMLAFPLFSQNSALYDSLSKALLIDQSIETKINTLLAISNEVEGSDPQLSIKHALNAYDISVSNGLSAETIQALIQLGNSYIRASEYQKAYENAEKAIEMAIEYDKKPEIARAKGILALIYYELGNFEKSAKLDFENLAYFEQVNDRKQIGLTLGNIGIDFISQNNYAKGLEYLKKSFDIAVKNKDLHGMAYQYNNIAGVYSEYYDDSKTALGYYKEALKINSRLDDQRQEAIYLMNIGNCYSKLHVNDSVMVYYNKANQLFKSLDNLYLYAECQTLIGEYYLHSNNLNLSFRSADTALRIGMQNDYKSKIKDAAALLHKIFLARKDTLNAYKYSIIENQAKDSLVAKQNQQELYKLEFQHNFEKIEKEKQIARQRKDNLLVVIILSLTSGLIILLLVFSRHRIRSRNIQLEKQAIEKELEFKNKELTINLISLLKKNEMLSGISTKLIEIEKGAKKDETKEAINKIGRELRNSADDKMLKEFTLRFQEVHSGFYEALLQKHPDLTQNELKLCAFLRLNMSTKDISELTGQRVLTIDHARYRLRKKLGISNSEINLVTFLSQI